MIPRRKVFQFNAQREWVYPKVLTCKYCRREIITDLRSPDIEPYYQRGILSVDFAYHMRCYNMRCKR